MKKTRLTADYSFSFDLFGLTSVAREYKLAWSINQFLGITLQKQKDHIIQFVDGASLVISHYLHQSEYGYFRLIKNKSCDGDQAYLVPEMKNFDFLIVFEDESGAISPEETLSRLSANPHIDFIARIDPEKLKSKDNLIFE